MKSSKVCSPFSLAKSTVCGAVVIVTGVPVPSATPTTIPEPGLPFSLVFRAEPGREDVLLKIASAYEAASERRVPPPAFGRLPTRGT